MKGLSRPVHSPFVTDRNPRAPSPPKGRPRRTRASFPAKAAAAASPSASRYPSLSAQYEPGEKPVVVVGSANADIYVEVDRLPALGRRSPLGRGRPSPAARAPTRPAAAASSRIPRTSLARSAKTPTGADRGGAGERWSSSRASHAGPRGAHWTCRGDSPAGWAELHHHRRRRECERMARKAVEEDLEVVRKAGVLLLQREIPDRVNIQVAEAAQGAGVPVILDAGGMEGPIPLELLKLVDIFSPNETELARLTGLPTETFEQISQAVRRCHEMGVKKILVKLGSKGSALFVEGKEPIRQPIIEASRVLDTTGAGDTFTAAFGVALVEGKTMEECLRFAAAAASLCIQVKGPSPVCRRGAQSQSFFSLPEYDSSLNNFRVEVLNKVLFFCG
ncbi:unnamed protein product [Spirodela intermedia]|uniref:Carbohydrate kinase PfkB domain-containing protein n=1 Tax=Spirodela intermedia TaxID=51605 RepID=A0A7I8JP60_SPIIN|nr:unnamed protein product [Spirodela intermedia]CAA6671353.1 unnamed protein product [Spirodela intermedia]